MAISDGPFLTYKRLLSVTPDWRANGRDRVFPVRRFRRPLAGHECRDLVESGPSAFRLSAPIDAVASVLIIVTCRCVRPALASCKRQALQSTLLYTIPSYKLSLWHTNHYHHRLVYFAFSSIIAGLEANVINQPVF